MSDTQQQAQDKAQQVAGQAQEKAQQARGQASDKIREQVDQRSTQAGEQVSATAQDVRSVGEQLREQGKAQPAPGTEPGLPFSIHHYMLSVYGIHHLENLNLAAMAADRVWTSCGMVLPSRDKGAAGAVIRPVAIGVPNQR